jgi:hypothetical protein
LLLGVRLLLRVPGLLGVRLLLRVCLLLRLVPLALLLRATLPRLLRPTLALLLWVTLAGLRLLIGRGAARRVPVLALRHSGLSFAYLVALTLLEVRSGRLIHDGHRR